MKPSPYRLEADRVLAGLFGRTIGQPTRQELFAAYPFEVRKGWRYRVWLRRVCAFKAARVAGLTFPPEIWNKRQPRKDERQLEIPQ